MDLKEQSPENRVFVPNKTPRLKTGSLRKTNPLINNGVFGKDKSFDYKRGVKEGRSPSLKNLFPLPLLKGKGD